MNGLILFNYSHFIKNCCFSTKNKVKKLKSICVHIIFI